MDPTTRLLMQGAAGAGKKLYVEDVFSTWLYTGNGSTQTITNGIDLSGKGGLVWTKARSAAYNHILVDTVRGRPNSLFSNATNAQGTASDISSFSSTGYALGLNQGYENNSGITYASWTFRKAAKFFDVVTYTGNATNRTIAHNLGSTPGCIIIKRTNAGGNWFVYHRGLASPTLDLINLNTTSAALTNFPAYWNSTAPTSTVFSLGTEADINANGGTYVAYLFAHDAGGFGDAGTDSVVSCGSYTGNGSTSGPTVTLGWEPQWLLVKRTDNANSWWMLDTMRGLPVGSGAAYLLANLSSAEASFGNDLLALSATGFRLITDNSNFNANGGSYIYIAIRRGPMKTPTDATKVFSASLRTGTGSVTDVTSLSFPTDLLLPKARSQAWYALDFYDRLRGSSLRLDPSAQSAEGTPTAYPSAFLQNGYTLTADANGYVNFSGQSYIDLNFRRAPGFFDIVAYTGTGVVRTVAHNLGVAPELLITKRRDSSSFWAVYYGLNTSRLLLNSTTSTAVDSAYWDNTSPTSTQFTVATNSAVNTNNGTYIAYLFASCPGVSKVGSYTGTGTTLQINCGFTSGARFVLIKRTDSTGDWYVWDSARGIVAGNDPYLLLNSIAAEVTNTDYVDTFSSGFEISSTAPAAINANGGSFIFLAVA
jgi:hypothetical protein